jgi:hypothetical protein
MKHQRQTVIDTPNRKAIQIELFSAGLHRITIKPIGFHVVIEHPENVVAFVAIALKEWVKL